ncbi:glycosyltransferase family 4 protein [Loktanella sp. Alg231-35]|uniref:glycosyltransferase family 4 protein n=1 Tax=Loktanella sp. Alg231-35 TaxID=1922220 RepID=UPI000D5525FC|nr:glycosyltransferase family 4 protein [Loktanella sp. Alg231-35]
MQTKPRVLVIAEAANPEWVSVPLIGWLHSEALRAVADVHVVTQARNRAAFLKAGRVEGEDFTAIDTEWLEAPAVGVANKLRGDAGKGWTTLQTFQSMTYPYFERLVWRKFKDQLRAGAFDIVHRITPMSPTSHSTIARKCAKIDVPFVLGPINGGLPWPKGFGAERRREREYMSYIRSAHRLAPGYRRMLDAASAIIVGSSATASEIPSNLTQKTIQISESAVDIDRFSLSPKEGLSTPLRACFVGRMVPYKGPDILLRAAAPLLREGRLHIDLIGDGPLMPTLNEIIASEGIAEAVTLHGWVPHENLQSTAIASDIFAFPSVREFGGTSILEMMAIGLVPVIVDYGGPGDNIPPDLGFKLPLSTRDQLITDLRATLTGIADDPAQLLALREKGQRWIHQTFTWPRRAEQINDIYQWVLGNRDSKPAPFG